MQRTIYSRANIEINALTRPTIMFSITANDLVTGNINLVIANRFIKRQNIQRTVSKQDSQLSICFGKVALCEEANLNPRIEGKK